MPENLISRIRTAPAKVAQSLARGLCDFLRFRPDLRRLYQPGDLAYIESLAAKGGDDGPTLYSKSGYDPNQLRDSTGKWTVEGRPDLRKLSKILEPARTADLSEDDVEHALAAWDHYGEDFGEMMPEAVQDKAEALLKQLWSEDRRKGLAVLSWMADRILHERGKTKKAKGEES